MHGDLVGRGLVAHHFKTSRFFEEIAYDLARLLDFI